MRCNSRCPTVPQGRKRFVPLSYVFSLLQARKVRHYEVHLTLAHNRHKQTLLTGTGLLFLFYPTSAGQERAAL